MSETIRNRIKAHRRVRAGDLLPHEFNFRTHPEMQRDALAALYREVGFARSLLAYELPDGRLKLIDGHLRRDIDPDMEVDVEVLDVTDEEARVLLLSIDPLAELAQEQEQLRQRLTELAPQVPEELKEAWQATAQGCLGWSAKGRDLRDKALVEQWYVLVECRDETQQVELLRRFQAEGLTCKAVLA
jgi:hypothetical protein